MRLRSHYSLSIVSIFSLGIFLGCAGPTTPFGALNTYTPRPSGPAPAKKAVASSPTVAAPTIKVWPDRLRLHAKAPVELTIHDPSGVPLGARLAVYYNGTEVSSSLKNGAAPSLSADRRTWKIRLSNIAYRAEEKNDITFVYRRGDGSPSTIKHYPLPECDLTASWDVKDLGAFSMAEPLAEQIIYWSRQKKINPSLTAGLIAQESSFNPRAVSSAKAIGLTQITPLADKELARVSYDWPRSWKINRHPAAVVKLMIATEAITAEDDWRLDPQRSIRGGLLYLDYLRHYWSRPDNRAVLASHFPHLSRSMTPIYLASYNSGPFRVKREINKFGAHFLESNELGEARRYVRRVQSYCYHFAHGGDT